MTDDVRPHLTEHEDTDFAQYHALSKAAVAALIMGLLAPAAMVDPLMWAAPALGVFFGGWALWKIAQNAPELTGGLIDK